jgi:hypothetical protein
VETAVVHHRVEMPGFEAGARRFYVANVEPRRINGLHGSPRVVICVTPGEPNGRLIATAGLWLTQGRRSARRSDGPSLSLRSLMAPLDDLETVLTNIRKNRLI